MAVRGLRSRQLDSIKLGLLLVLLAMTILGNLVRVSARTEL